ncbi:hypothetical protein LIER_40372 [Lithospermum erythrorhizon]|uniref:Copia protein n=1 Tax=Lithospermum erythrorhizon TaxID=34254 RepID=A0AAV3QWP0_LITER
MSRLFTEQAKFIACHQATVHAVWLRNFIAGLRVLNGIERPLNIYCHNRAAILYSKNNKSSTKSRHIERKFLIVKERIQSGTISFEHIGTNSMIADPLTKGLPPNKFVDHTAHMGVMSSHETMI